MMGQHTALATACGTQWWEGLGSGVDRGQGSSSRRHSPPRPAARCHHSQGHLSPRMQLLCFFMSGPAAGWAGGAGRVETLSSQGWLPLCRRQGTRQRPAATGQRSRCLPLSPTKAQPTPHRTAAPHRPAPVRLPHSPPERASLVLQLAATKRGAHTCSPYARKTHRRCRCSCECGGRAALPSPPRAQRGTPSSRARSAWCRG